MTNTTNKEKKVETVTQQRTVLLDIPARLQWENDHGYCGETAIQSFGLYYGAWISQKLVRDINKGEYLLQKLSVDDHRNPTHTLTALHFTYNEWDWESSAQPQFYDFCRWIKRSIIQGHPAMFGAYLSYMQEEDYDHIMPAIGVRFQDEHEYNPEDVLFYYNLFREKLIERTMSKDDLAATRKTCRKHCGEGGSLPLNIDYGIAVTGIADENQITLPVRLSVSAWNEPNLHPAYAETPIEMDGIVTIRDLVVDKPYVLLRYSSYGHIPTKGRISDFLSSNFDEKHTFVANYHTYIYKDSKKIPSTGSVYYRCVPLLEK
ncbi:unnamed protein product [Rotaria magnacalcarata]|uniref:Peptidase C39-like domain-containing protein n=1 Tax=Rotaria magnacalcarata TaxID=392030 RepID=A0A816H768_9BILA|nr:unnamed protein product [Rotaria magnacalcarata]CAF1683543.1 unnamed protein product [Rotaria magnacalcarata]CAF4395715.1 unnamed protein product [Rotaria magnacalcarata]CAF4685325.1 unnamed protein product [Rotaria magnacalcarata]